MKKIIAGFVATIMIFTLIPTAALASKFKDMPTDWSTAALEAAVSNGLLKGDNGKIMPKALMTRAQMAAIISRAFGTTEEASLSNFNDVQVSAWYYHDMAKAVHMQAFKGSGNQLNPNNYITREEAFVVLARAFKLSESDTKVLNQFSDKSSISSWAESGIAGLVAKGYVAGAEGKLNPKQNITRAEFAKIMDNLVKTYIQKEGIYSKDTKGNVMVNVPGVVLKNMTITGDLIVGDGVGNGEVTLENVVVTGTAIVRGGGVNSIRIIGNSNVKSILIARVNGEVRVFADEGTQVGTVIVDGDDNVIIEGGIEEIRVEASNITVTAKNATIDTIVINGAQSKIVFNARVTVDNVAVNAKDAEILAEKGSNIKKIEANQEGLKVNGNGTVEAVKANANNIVVKTNGASVTAATGTTGIVAGSTNVPGGRTITVSDSTTNTGGGGGGGGASSIAVSAITVTGDAVVGATLTAVPTPLNATGNYQWQVSDNGTDGWVNIGTNTNSYEIAAGDTGKSFRIVFTASGNYSGNQTSNILGPVAPIPAPEFAGGSGTLEDPYQVATAEQLNNVRYNINKHFIQIENIELGVAPWNVGEGWEPIGDYVDGTSSFQGVYDGNNHTIGGLYINKPTKYAVGLFGEMTNGAVVKNLKLINVNMTGKDFVGAVSGGWGGRGYEDSSVINVHVSGNVTGNDNVGGLVGTNSTVRLSSSTAKVHGTNAGGLVGLNQSGHLIEQSYAAGEITGSATGGLVGHNNYGLIKDSYSIAEVKGTGSFNGGVVGNSYSFSSSLTNVYAAGKVDNGGGLIGVNHNGQPDYEDSSYWDKDTTGRSVSANSESSFGKTSTEMMQQATFSGWDFDTIWAIDEGMTYPYLRNNQQDPKPASSPPFEGGLGTLENPYKVANAQQLYEVRNYKDKHFVQTANIDLDIASWNEGEGWEPIVDFEGSYDGNEKTISNLMINRPTENGVGLFGKLLEDALIRDLTLLNVSVVGNSSVGSILGLNQLGILSNISAIGTVNAEASYVGGLVGNLQGGLVEQCHATVDVSGFEWVGGLVGGSPNATIRKSSALGNVNGTGRYIGGLVGAAENAAITESHASGVVTGTSHTVGGLIGYLWGDVEESYATGEVNGHVWVGGLVGDFGTGTIKTSYASGSVNGSGGTRNAIGGLVGATGRSEGSVTLIQNSYATGSVTGNRFIGGLIGANNGTINNAYATGSVSGSQDTGGLVGVNGSSPVNNSFWNKDTTNQTTSAGSDAENGKTSEEMKVLALYVDAGWVFSNIWTINSTDNDGYPALQWQGFDHQ